jgi:hypothetical protein
MGVRVDVPDQRLAGQVGLVDGQPLKLESIGTAPTFSTNGYCSATA